MYRRRDKEALPLFAELMPFGGKLDESNRWFKYEEMIPWERLEQEYAKYFSPMGRPGLPCRLVIGALCIKHMSGASDDEVELMIRESPYMQYFCGLEELATKPLFDGSSLSKLRKRLGKEYFEKFEGLVFEALKKAKVIRARGVLFDATVVPVAVKYPTDAGLLNEAREWLVGQIGKVGRCVGKSFRRYKRKAREEYLSFAKTRKKTFEGMRGAVKKMLGYVRRNLQQFEECVQAAQAKGITMGREVLERLKVIRCLYDQQRTMYKEKVRRIPDRIVSLHQRWVRPIVRGKAGKEVEFGPKVAFSFVDGFLFADKISDDAFNEACEVPQQLRAYEERFGKLPGHAIGDGLYGTRENRKLLMECGIRDAFKKLGRPETPTASQKRWKRLMQRKRSQIEGAIGHAKEHLHCDRIRYKIDEGREIWIRMALSMMNLRTAAARL